jgi:hypothetical protein
MAYNLPPVTPENSWRSFALAFFRGCGYHLARMLFRGS